MPGLAEDAAQRVSVMVRRVDVEDRPVTAELQIDLSAVRLALDWNFSVTIFSGSQAAVVHRLAVVRRVQILDEDVLEVGAGDRQTPGERVVVADAHADKRRLRGADHVPARRVQMDDVAQRRIGDRAVRIVRDDRLAGRRHRAADDPVVAARVGDRVDRKRRGASACGDAFRNASMSSGRGSVPGRASPQCTASVTSVTSSPFGTCQVVPRIGRRAAVGFLDAVLRHVHRQPQLARRHCRTPARASTTVSAVHGSGLIPVSGIRPAGCRRAP